MKKFSSILLYVLLFASLSLIFLISILSKNNFTMQTTSTGSFIAFLLDDVSASDDVIFITEKTEEVRASAVVKKILAKTTTKATTAKAKKNDGLVQKDGSVADKYVTKANKQMNKLPDKLVQKFRSNGWTIEVTDKNLAKTYFDGKYSSVRGVTIYSQKKILIEDRDVAVENSPLHEFGHFIDYTTGLTSRTSEFKSIYKEECDTFKKRIPNASSVRDEMEFFATVFCYYYKDSSKLTPKAKAYIEQIIENL